MSIKQKILKDIILVCAFLVLLTPMLVSVKLASDLTVIQASYFYGVVSIMGLAWGLLAFSNKEYRLRFSHPIVLTVTIFTLILLLNLFVSIDPLTSFWGTKERMMGVLSYIYFWLWFAGLVTVFKKQDWLLLLKTSVLLSVIFSLKAVFDWSNAGMLLDNEHRIGSVFDNPLFFAQYLLPHFFLSIYFLVKENNWQNRVILSFCTVITLFALFLTVSRASILALLVGGFFSILFLVFEEKKPRKQILLSALVLLITLSVASFLVMRLPSIRTNLEPNAPYIMKRLYYSDKNQDRFFSWKIAGQAISEKPILGFGHNTFSPVFDKHFVTNIGGVYLNEPWFDRVHNQVLEVLVNLGLVGFVFWLLMWSSTLQTLFSHSEKQTTKRERLAKKILLTLFVASLTQLFFLFDLFSSSITLYMLLAYSVYITKDAKIKKITAISGLQIPEIQLRLIHFVILGFFLVPLELYLCIYPYRSTVAGSEAIILIRDRSGEALKFVKRASAHRSFLTGDIMSSIAIELRTSEKKEQQHSSDSEQILRIVTAELEHCATHHPNNYRINYITGSAIQLLSHYDSTFTEKAEYYSNYAIELAPNRPESYITLGDIELARRNPELALMRYQSAMERMPTFSRTFFEQRVALEFQYVLAYASMLEFDTAFKKLHKVEKMGLLVNEDARLLPILASTYEKGEYDTEILEYTVNTLPIFQDNAQVLRSGAVIFNRAGESFAVDKALEMLAIVDAEDAKKLRSELGLE